MAKFLASDASSLVQTVSGVDFNSEGGFASQFDGKSLGKSRVALNDLVEKAWKLINDLERIEAEAIDGISQKEQEILDFRVLILQERWLYNLEYAVNKADLEIRQCDLEVVQFILVSTKCKGATSLSQTKARVCETQSGRKTLLFSDGQVAWKHKTLLTPRAKNSIDQILRSVEQASLLLQPAISMAPPPVVKKDPVIGEDGKPCMVATGQVSGGAATEFAGEVMGDENQCMKSCGPDPPDCGLLHDKLSLLWGEYKDKFVELTMEMMHGQIRFTEMEITLN